MCAFVVVFRCCHFGCVFQLGKGDYEQSSVEVLVSCGLCFGCFPSDFMKGDQSIIEP